MSKLKFIIFIFTFINLIASLITEKVAESENADLNEQEFSILNLSGDLEDKLKSIRNSDLGKNIIQEMFDLMEYTPASYNDVEIIDKIAKRLKSKLDPAIEIINEMCEFLNNEIHNETNFLSLLNPCPNSDSVIIKMDHYYNEIFKNIPEANKFDILNDKNLIFHKYLNERIKLVDESLWNSKRQYFLSSYDKATIENCNDSPSHDDTHLTSLYVSAIKNKHVVLLMDHGNALNGNQMLLTRIVAKSIVKLLNDTDKIQIFGISDKVTHIIGDQLCSKTENLMFSATLENKQIVYDFIDNLNKSAGSTNHSLGFQAAFQLFAKLYDQKDERIPISFLYISRGLLSPLSEAKNVLEIISQGQSSLPYPVILNTCAIIIDKRRIMYEIQFLQDITYQNYTKFNLTSEWNVNDRSLSGKLFVVNKTNREYINKLGIVMFSELFEHDEFINPNLTLHKPFYDAMGDELNIPITKACQKRGVFGIDFNVDDIVEDILYSNALNYSYKFLTDLHGNTISHHLYPRPSKIKSDLQPVHIKFLENKKGFESLWRKISSEETGNGTLDFGERVYSYTWKHVSSLMIVCMVTDKSSSQIPSNLDPSKSPLSVFDSSYEKNSLPNLLYHRLDLIPSTNSQLSMCQYFKQIITYDATALYLSARAFISPYTHLKNNRPEIVDDQSNYHTIQNFMAYLKDTTNLFANPGMLNEIRNDVIALYHVMEVLKKKHFESKLKKYVIRRYSASTNGVMQVYPGCILDPNFEPSRRPWFKKAMENPGQISITEPYLDAGGAGYVVSISYTIFAGYFNKNQPIIVVSMDLTHGFFYKMLLEASPVCSQVNIKCFLMEDNGYLVAHPSVLAPASIINRHPVEHIAQKEPQIANDILNHRKFVKKIACNNYLNGTVQRSYQFNTSINEIITNWANVEKTKYQIALIKNTNLFVGVINSTSSQNGAFCPCNVVDFLCLNCNRMEQTECECPCECNIFPEDCQTASIMKNSIQSANETLAMKNSTWQACPQPIEYVWSFTSPHLKETVDACEAFPCELFSSAEECLGVLGCVWCYVNYDETPLSTPYCTLQSACYSGVYGSSDAYGNAYDNLVIDSMINYNFLPPTYSAILPVIGVVITLFVIVGFAMYCYKLNYDSSGFGEHLYADSIQDNCIGMMPMNRLDFYDDTPDDHDLGMGGNSLNQRLLQNPVSNAIIMPNISSPYRIATNYRRPNYADSSDHGYSTMTPQNDDSEHHTNNESLINNRIRRLSMSDSASVNTSVSSPQNNQPYDLPQTKPHIVPPISDQTSQLMNKQKMLSPNKFLAEVQVHRHMEMES